jgi:hypothetical protein
MPELARALVHSMIDQASVSWSVIPVRHVAIA